MISTHTAFISIGKPLASPKRLSRKKDYKDERNRELERHFGSSRLHFKPLHKVSYSLPIETELGSLIYEFKAEKLWADT